eukprot:Colp12_sorted_trinity150504_noHs@13101
MPNWGRRFIGSNTAYVLEESVVDPKNRIMTTYTRNLNHAKITTVEEKCVYRPHPENSEWTECHLEAVIASPVKYWSSALERFVFERFKKHAELARQALQNVADSLTSQPA